MLLAAIELEQSVETPSTCQGCGVSVAPYLSSCSDCLTEPGLYYIVAVDTLVDIDNYDNPEDPGVKSFSVIKITEDGGYEVDRAYRSVVEALEVWPEATPPRML